MDGHDNVSLGRHAGDGVKVPQDDARVMRECALNNAKVRDMAYNSDHPAYSTYLDRKRDYSPPSSYGS